MNGQASSSPAARLTAVLVFAGVPVLALVLSAANLAAAASGREQIAQSEDLLAALSGRLDVLDPQGALDTARIYLAGDSASLAAADLRTRLSAAIAQAGGRLVETRSIDADPADAGTDAVALGATFDIDNAGLARLLHALESGTPLMDVEELAVRRTQTDSRSENPALRTDLVVKAFRDAAAS